MIIETINSSTLEACDVKWLAGYQVQDMGNDVRVQLVKGCVKLWLLCTYDYLGE